MKTLYFEGAGWSGADSSKATIGNCRIRTAFHLTDGRGVYLEIVCCERTKNSSPLIKWPYTGSVTDCYYITDDKPNDDCNRHRVRLQGEGSPYVEHNTRFDYTEKEILKFVNSLGADFDSVKVCPDLGGYRVFPEQGACTGPGAYYYGDEFTFEPELLRRREMVYEHFYQLEQQLGRKHPNFDLYVDEHDKGSLHLIRHFVGYNKHWLIRVDLSGDIKDILNTTMETKLGKYGC